ncbi:PREDICTED: uncharacterized protein LOC108685168 [Atta colombica]|uniref:uncharacterized protein LOC108685168 n=1 Tax=Atta colombica TaxID=520822 RepID=UPI00084C0B4D|nr:PREDICTED: uncharacterized protein LOC108685168 [Atta colombica]
MTLSTTSILSVGKTSISTRRACWRTSHSGSRSLSEISMKVACVSTSDGNLRTEEWTSSYVVTDDDDDYLAVRTNRCPPTRTMVEQREAKRVLPGAAVAPHLSILS